MSAMKNIFDKAIAGKNGQLGDARKKRRTQPTQDTAADPGLLRRKLNLKDK